MGPRARSQENNKVKKWGIILQETQKIYRIKGLVWGG
jgi:hypothetical protein